jgi:hypothetical protein
MTETVSGLPYPKRGDAEKYVLKGDLLVEEWIVPAGTEVTLDQTRNFGWIFLPEGCRDKRGFLILKKIFSA